MSDRDDSIFLLCAVAISYSKAARAARFFTTIRLGVPLTAFCSTKELNALLKASIEVSNSVATLVFISSTMSKLFGLVRAQMRVAKRREMSPPLPLNTSR